MEERFKQAVERGIRAVSADPTIGQGAETMHFEYREDGSCKIMAGDQEMVIDMGEEDGGNGTTPSPGFYAKAALGACFVLGFRAWAAYFDVPIDRIEVELQTEYDARGMYGIDENVPASYTACRCIVEIESPAPREKVMEVIEHTDANSPMHCLWVEETPLEKEIRIVAS